MLGTNSCTTSGVHKSRRWGCPGDKIMYSDASYLWVLSIELELCHHSGAQNFKVAHRFLETFCTLLYIMLRYIIILCIKYNIIVYYMFSLRTGRSGNRIPVGAKFSAPVKTGPGAYPASCTMGTGSLLRG